MQPLGLRVLCWDLGFRVQGYKDSFSVRELGFSDWCLGFSSMRQSKGLKVL